MTTATALPIATPAPLPPRLKLLSSGDGWSLVSDDGYLVYSASGVTGRRRCLEAARAWGALTLAH